MKRHVLGLTVAIVLSLLAPASASAATFSHLAFSDEFNGTTTSIGQKWGLKDYCNFGPGPPTGASQACFTPSQVTEGNGALSIAATYQPFCGSFACWLSGQVESKAKVTPPIKVVSRAKVAGGTGMWNAPAWMGNGCMEVDVMEQLGYAATGGIQSVHRWSCTGSHVGRSEWAETGKTLSQAYHRYRADVYATQVQFYIDGVLTNTITESEIGGVGSWRMLYPMTFKASLNVGTCGGWAKCPNYIDTRVEKIDWYRVWTP